MSDVVGFSKRERRLEYQRQHSAKARERCKRIIAEAKSKPCLDCHQSFPPYCMDFDHVRGVKKFNIGAATGSMAYNVEALIEEIGKCDVICANCHRIRTHGSGERTWRTETKKKLRDRIADKAKKKAEAGGRPVKEHKEELPKWQTQVQRLPRW